MRKKLHDDWHWVWPTGNGDLGNQGIRPLGMVLLMDPQTERFIGNTAADQMLSREYRRPFVVPEQV
jgi:hypothetical protein